MLMLTSPLMSLSDWLTLKSSQTVPLVDSQAELSNWLTNLMSSQISHNGWTLKSLSNWLTLQVLLNSHWLTYQESLPLVDTQVLPNSHWLTIKSPSHWLTLKSSQTPIGQMSHIYDSQQATDPFIKQRSVFLTLFELSIHSPPFNDSITKWYNNKKRTSFREPHISRSVCSPSGSRFRRTVPFNKTGSWGNKINKFCGIKMIADWWNKRTIYVASKSASLHRKNMNRHNLTLGLNELYCIVYIIIEVNSNTHQMKWGDWGE